MQYITELIKLELNAGVYLPWTCLSKNPELPG